MRVRVRVRSVRAGMPRELRLCLATRMTDCRPWVPCVPARAGEGLRVRVSVAAASELAPIAEPLVGVLAVHLEHALADAEVEAGPCHRAQRLLLRGSPRVALGGDLVA